MRRLPARAVLALAALALPGAPARPAPADGPGAAVRRALAAHGADRLAPLLAEAVRFPTVAGDAAAFAAQAAWLRRVAAELGLAVRETPTVTEVELPGPAGAPVLGLAVHGDVVAVDAREWRSPPFEGAIREGQVWGRGAVDDKAALVQALLVMAALRDAGVPRTHGVRLLVGSSEESDSGDLPAYLVAHAPPAMTLVLDSDFPVVIGEKAWTLLEVLAPPEGPGDAPVEVAALTAGQSPSIVPDRAVLRLRWRRGTPDWEPLLARVRARPLPPGTALGVGGEGAERTLTVTGRSAHAGVALAEGRNALVALARAVEGLLPRGGAADLLAFAAEAGGDLAGAGLGLAPAPPPWGGFETNVATVQPAEGGGLALGVNIRAPPTLQGEALRGHLAARLAAFDARTGAALRMGPGWYGSRALALDPEGKLVRRLRAAYQRVTGRDDPPVASPGGTYAKHIPDAVPFGPWFPGHVYPGHAPDERMPVAALREGALVLAEAVGDLACGPPLPRPLERE